MANHSRSPIITPGRGTVQRLKVALLSELEIFADLPEGDIDRLLNKSTMAQIPRGRVLSPNEMDEVLFILKKGRVQLYRLSADGKKFVIDVLGPGSVFGECVLTGQRLSGAFVEAVEDSVLCILHRADLERLIMVAPRVGLRLLEILGRRIYELEERLEEMAFKRVPSRLAALLLRLAAREGNPIEGYTHQDFADMIGTYRETVTQALNEMKQQGLLEVGRKHVRILDEQSIRLLAEQ